MEKHKTDYKVCKNMQIIAYFVCDKRRKSLILKIFNF